MLISTQIYKIYNILLSSLNSITLFFFVKTYVIKILRIFLLFFSLSLPLSFGFVSKSFCDPLIIAHYAALVPRGFDDIVQDSILTYLQETTRLPYSMYELVMAPHLVITHTHFLEAIDYIPIVTQKLENFPFQNFPDTVQNGQEFSNFMYGEQTIERFPHL